MKPLRRRESGPMFADSINRATDQPANKRPAQPKRPANQTTTEQHQLPRAFVTQAPAFPAGASAEAIASDMAALAVPAAAAARVAVARPEATGTIAARAAVRGSRETVTSGRCWGLAPGSESPAATGPTSPARPRALLEAFCSAAGPGFAAADAAAATTVRPAVQPGSAAASVADQSLFSKVWPTGVVTLTTLAAVSGDRNRVGCPGSLQASGRSGCGRQTQPTRKPVALRANRKTNSQPVHSTQL